MNGDGLPDIVVADYAVSLFLQTAPGTFASAAGLYPGGANWVAVGDLNGDGIPDIVNGVQGNAPGVLLQNSGSPGTFAALQPLP